MEPTIVKTQHLKSYPSLDPRQLSAEFHGKSVLITGGGYGIGASIAQAFAQAGVASVILAGRNIEPLKSTAAELTAQHKDLKVTYHTLDLSSPETIAAFFAWLQLQPLVDILVNNAGFLPSPTNFLDADLTASWWAGFEVNILGTALLTQSFLRYHRDNSTVADGLQTRAPAIVITLNTIGAYSVRPPALSAYGASKAGLARLFELITADVPEDIARFITVHPGFVQTAMAQKSGLEGVFQETDAQLAAEFVVWTATEEASFLSGRFVWVNWDKDELVAKNKQIVEEDLLRTALSGT